ncbi:M35 family metallo-endopeptidase [Pseudomonas viridiflava]|uniref:M35 family metallo-endopeptidase n=1 Tax=Pseudomonas viridiflava TaxID=33069 RepID=UPI000F01BE38|nr:M35 family metallo-endopeptidase [Pseudomonas viridiflava]
MPIRQLTAIEARTFRAARWAALRSLNYTIAQLSQGNAATAIVWLGVDHPALDIVVQGLDRIRAALTLIHQGQINHDTAGQWFAEVLPNDPTHCITLGLHFFDTATYGNDSRAGTLIHEVSHFNDVLATHDHAYGHDQCRALVHNAALNNDQLRTVLTNADNWEYLIENTY